MKNLLIPLMAGLFLISCESVNVVNVDLGKKSAGCIEQPSEQAEKEGRELEKKTKKDYQAFWGWMGMVVQNSRRKECARERSFPF